MTERNGLVELLNLGDTFVIRNKKTGMFVYGTDYRYFPPHQRASAYRALTFETEEKAELAFVDRRCGRDYEVVKARIDVVE